MKTDRNFRIAIKKAKESEFSRARIGAVIEKGGRILSTGTNQIRGHSIKKCKHESSLHAEADAINKLLKAYRQQDLIGATIYVSRVQKDWTPALAKPCKFCTGLIESVGIKRIVYTTNNGTEEIKL